MDKTGKVMIVFLAALILWATFMYGRYSAGLDCAAIISDVRFVAVHQEQQHGQQI